MKKPIQPAGYSLMLLFALFSVVSCQKPRDYVSPPSSSFFFRQVVGTTPEKSGQNSAYDDNIKAKLNFVIDTVTQQTTLQVFQNETMVPGTVKVEDSVVVFEPADELLPLHTYTATLTITERFPYADSFIYQWSFTTKAPDEYSMMQRSTKVTGFERDGNRNMQIGDYLYSFGGWTDNGVPLVYNDVYRSHGDLSVWEKRADAPWHGRHVYGLVKLDSFTYVVGGDPWQPVFDVWRTADGENWTLLSENGLGNRTLYGCAAHNGYIYVAGGLGHNDVWRSADGIKWDIVAENVAFLKGENFSGSLISFNGRLWMVCGGGDGWGGGAPRSEVWSSADGKTWRKETEFPGCGRYYTDVCVWDNKLWVIGGYNYTEGNTKSIWFMRPNGRWTEYNVPREYIGRHATGVAVYNNSLTITCGNYHNDCWVIEKVK